MRLVLAISALLQITCGGLWLLHAEMALPAMRTHFYSDIAQFESRIYSDPRIDGDLVLGVGGERKDEDFRSMVQRNLKQIRIPAFPGWLLIVSGVISLAAAAWTAGRKAPSSKPDEA